MTLNNNHSVLPFYTDINKQAHRKSYAYGEVYPLITPNLHILPFQIIRVHNSTTVNTTGFNVSLYHSNGTLYESITTSMRNTGLRIASGDEYDVIIYHGRLPFTAFNTPEGQYYLIMTDTVNTWYSEVFTIVHDVSRFLKLEFRNTDDILLSAGWIDYTIPFRFMCYLNTEVGRPEYRFDEEAEDRDGYSFVEKQVSEKVFKFQFLAPEYLVDALRLVRLNDYIRITTNDDIYDVEKFLITPEWTEEGYLANVIVEFECDTVVKKIAKGSYYSTAGSFNNDYDESFDI